MKRFFFQLLMIVLLTFALSWSADKLMSLWLLRAAFPETIALEDFHWEDFAFKLRSDKPLESRIVLVNVANAGRREIARMVEIINQSKPKVIGLDIFFDCDGPRDTIHCQQMKDTFGNALLSEAIKKANNVVLPSRPIQTFENANNDIGAYDSVEYSDFEFKRYAHNAFISLIVSATNLDVKETRSFPPSIVVKGEKEYAFSVQVAMMYDSLVTRKLLERRNEEELINFRGNVGKYQYDLGTAMLKKEQHFEEIEYDSLMQEKFPKELFKDKIVLVGYLGEYLNDPTYLDKYYTPLNATFAGRSVPDMLSLVVHANIISMILNQDYIDQLSDFWENLILTIIVALNAAFFIILLQRNSIWYDSLCFIIPVVQIVLISWLRIELMKTYNFRLDLQNVLYLIAFVSFATNLYFGPLLALTNKFLSSAFAKRFG